MSWKSFSMIRSAVNLPLCKRGNEGDFDGNRRMIMPWKYASICFLTFVFIANLALAAGTFGGLVVQNRGQVKNGENISYYMDAPWGRVYVTEQGLLLNIQRVGPDSVGKDPATPSPFAKGGMRGISMVIGG